MKQLFSSCFQILVVLTVATMSLLMVSASPTAPTNVHPHNKMVDKGDFKVGGATLEKSGQIQNGCGSALQELAD